MTDVHNDVLADEDFATILSENIEFAGIINFEKSLLVRGKLSGTIDARGTLLVDEGAVVNSDISADRLIVRGAVRGDVVVTQRLEVAGSGRLHGDVSAPEICMETGCTFNGKCVMPESEAPEAGRGV